MALGYQNPFYLKQAQQEQQSLYNGKVQLGKHDPPDVYDWEETLELAQESRLKMKQLNKEIKPANYTKINHLFGVFVSQTAKSHEELYFSSTSKMANVSKSISIPNKEFSDDTTSSVEQKFLNEKLENENVELEFQVQNYEKENAHLKTAYKNLFDSINVTRDQTKMIIDSLQNKLHDTIYENAKLRAQLFDKVSEQKDTTKVTLNSVPTTRESKVVENDKVIAPGVFRINPFKNSREEKFVPNKPIKASVRTNPSTISQPYVITKKVINSDSNGFSSIRVDITTRTRRPQLRSNTKNDRVPSASKSSRIKNKEVEQCLIIANHDVCVLNYVNGMNSRGKKQKENVSNIINQTKHMPRVKKPKKVGFPEILASPKPSKPRMCLRWLPTGKMFDIKGKLIASSESKGDNACTSNPQEPTIKRFPNSTSSLGRNLKGVDLLKGNRTTNLYTINLHDMASASPICLMARATSTKSWLWHQRLSHLNFDTINDLARNDLVISLPKFKYHKEHLCPSCEQGKSKRAFHPPKPVPNSKQRLHLLHMDLCGPMRIESINGKRYVLVIVDDYSRYTWVIFLRSKDDAPEEIKTFLKKITVLLQAPVIIAEAIATACYTQNRSIIHHRFDKTPYDLINGRKSDISFLHIFGALCYPKNDREDIGKLGAKGDIGFFIGYSANSCVYKVYNQRAKKIMETMNVTFDELSAMAFEQSSLKPRLQSELDLLFKAMYDDHIGGQPSAAPRTVLAAQAPQIL
ncbi:retrovirus-related pol polyprotein from transposon TNT 1-94 [Tanacetum coccineum]|uniref:Retrovirus-related pol polyprotein from transposon TNT 1-94 n=1 Tax=Tanacetum coccineum TaxID=301880 RepID=A0ABQ5BX35_9ASTR